MSKVLQDFLPKALGLTVSERAELAAELLVSLDGEPEADVEAAWAAEIECRAKRVADGDAKGRPWSEVDSVLRGPR